ncbi:MAG TPA: hypothetical protein VN258_09500 [Mobilitalea sp.]|nr:hypothetical protein [Mobilitalea sp.]
MNEEKLFVKDYESCLQTARECLKRYEFEVAYEYIMRAVWTDPNRPEPQNLLGLWYELKGDTSLARKHYRVAYVLDPIYKPASVNLERVSTIFPVKEIPFDFGEITLEENPKPPMSGKNKAAD